MKNIVIMGLGFMGRMHADVYARLPAANVIAVVDPRKAEAERAVAELGLKATVHPSLRTALAAHPIDIVDICLPTQFHAAAVRQAIRVRKHVFCEKPLTFTAREGRMLAAAARKAGIKMQVGHCIRFWPEYEWLERFVRGRSAGRLLSLSLQRRSGRPTYSTNGWINRRTGSGGAALDLHIHDTDYIHHLLGKPSAVTSIGTKEKGGWNHIFTHYHYENVAVTAEGGWTYPVNWGFQMAFQAVFERAAVEFDSRATPALVFVDGDGGRTPVRLREQALKKGRGVGNITQMGGYFGELRYFLDCVEGDRMPAIATPEQAAESVETIMAEIRSAETGRTVRR